MSDKQLPEGWTSVPLSDLLVLKYGTGLPAKERLDGVIPVYGSNGIVGLHNKAISGNDTLIIGRKGSVGAIHLSEQPCWPIDTTYFVDDWPSMMPPKYWFYLLKHINLVDKEKSSAIPGISREDIYKVVVPLAPLPEQRRIVAKLDELMNRLNAARAKLERVPGLLAHFRRAVLSAACSGALTRDWREGNDDVEWEETNLRSLTLNLDQGWSPKCENFASPSDEKWGVIKTTAVQQITFLEAENKCLPDTLEARPNLELKSGDVLITRAGPRSRAGVSCYVGEVRPKLMICDKVYRVRAYRKKLDPQFLVFFLNTPAMVEQIDGLKTGSSDSGLNLTQERFLAIEIKLPPLAEQIEIVARVNALWALADSLEARFEKAQAFFDRLPGALLAKAFRGELVPQAPDDESAETLLQQLRAAKSEGAMAAKRAAKTKQPRKTRAEKAAKAEVAPNLRLDL